MKKKMIAAYAALLTAAGTAFAEGSSSIPEIDTQPITDLATAIKTWLSSVIPIVLPVLGAVLIFFLVKWAWRVIKSFMSAGK